MRSIAVVPHLYQIHWAVALNDYLSQVFISPFRHCHYASYLPSRSHYHAMLAEGLIQLRRQKITDVFLVNFLEDFSADFVKAGFVEHLHGIIHGSNFQCHEPGASAQLRLYEQAVVSAGTHLFTATHTFAAQLPYPTHVVGLPVFGQVQPPTQSSSLLFSHRLNQEKNPLQLLRLPPEMRARVVVTTPHMVPRTLALLREAIPAVWINLPHRDYLAVVRSCGYWLSFAVYDNFGYSLMEAILCGLLPLAYESDTTSYRELLPSDYPYLFRNEKEQLEMLDYLLSHFQEEYNRWRVVLQEHARKQFSLVPYVRRYLELMVELEQRCQSQSYRRDLNHKLIATFGQMIPGKRYALTDLTRIIRRAHGLQTQAMTERRVIREAFKLRDDIHLDWQDGPVLYRD